jgi:hypothetical protein
MATEYAECTDLLPVASMREWWYWLDAKIGWADTSRPFSGKDNRGYGGFRVGSVAPRSTTYTIADGANPKDVTMCISYWWEKKAFRCNEKMTMLAAEKWNRNLIYEFSAVKAWAQNTDFIHFKADGTKVSFPLWNNQWRVRENYNTDRLVPFLHNEPTDRSVRSDIDIFPIVDRIGNIIYFSFFGNDAAENLQTLNTILSGVVNLNTVNWTVDRTTPDGSDFGDPSIEGTTSATGMFGFDTPDSGYKVQDPRIIMGSGAGSSSGGAGMFGGVGPNRALPPGGGSSSGGSGGSGSGQANGGSNMERRGETNTQLENVDKNSVFSDFRKVEDREEIPLQPSGSGSSVSDYASSAWSGMMDMLRERDLEGIEKSVLDGVGIDISRAVPDGAPNANGAINLDWAEKAVQLVQDKVGDWGPAIGNVLRDVATSGLMQMARAGDGNAVIQAMIEGGRRGVQREVMNEVKKRVIGQKVPRISDSGERI